MHFTDFAIRKLFTYLQIPFFKVFQINLFTFFYKRIDNVNLASFSYLLMYGTIKTFATIIKLMNSSNRLPSRR